MRFKRLASFSSAFIISLSSIMAMPLPKVLAAAPPTITWDGGGTDKKFSTALNWSGDVAPVNGDSLIILYMVTLLTMSGILLVARYHNRFMAKK